MVTAVARSIGDPELTASFEQVLRASDRALRRLARAPLNSISA
jgi:hypothetical protein